MAILIKQKRHCRSLQFRVLGKTLQGEEHGGNVLVTVNDPRVERALIRQHNFKRAQIEVVRADGSKVKPEIKQDLISEQENKPEEPVEKPKRRRRKKKAE